MVIVKKIFLTGLLGVVVAAGFSAWLQYRYLQRPLNLPAGGILYTLDSGASLSHLARDLGAKNIIAMPRMLVIYSRLSGRGRVIKAGEYRLNPGTTLAELLDELERGDVVQYPVTIIEGATVVDILKQLRSQEKLKNDSSPDVNEIPLERLSITGADNKSWEGMFFPDTYYYHAGMSSTQILQQSHRKMQQVLQEEWSQRQPGLPLSNPYEALILASIVEKETGAPEERSQIAGVFIRRLQKKMRLQTDPTVIYGLGPDFDGNLRTLHLQNANNPFNTYRHFGLPPSPIAAPGRAAIHAVLHPAPGEELYFVAKGDGSHYFSSTLEQHQQAVRKYQINQRVKNYSSAPQKKSQ